MSASVSRQLEQAFEQLGQIREHLTGLQLLAADVDDTELSRYVDQGLRANTIALTHVSELSRMSKTTTEPPDEDLDSQNVEGLREVPA